MKTQQLQANTESSIQPVTSSTPSPTIDPNADAFVSVTYEHVYKRGTTTNALIDLATVKSAPPIPTGYSVHRNMVYRIETDAIFSGATLTRFRISSADANVFRKLRVLHLEADEFSSVGYSWKDQTLLEGKWQRDKYPQMSKEEHEKAVKPMEERIITAAVEQLGVFIVALRDQEPIPPLKPFSRLDISQSNTPDPIVGERDVVFTLILTNKGPKAIGEINLQYDIDDEMEFLSATSSQGKCVLSTSSSFAANCYLGALTVGASASIQVAAHVKNNREFYDRVQSKYTRIFIAIKERPADIMVNANWIDKRFPLRAVGVPQGDNSLTVPVPPPMGPLRRR